MPEPLPASPEDEPLTFSYTSIGLPGIIETNIRWDSRSKRLLYTKDEQQWGESKEEKTFQPSGRQWRALWKLLEALRAWSWQTSYINRGMMDGHHWQFSVSRGDNFLSTGGANDYPPGWQILQKFINQLAKGALYDSLHDFPDDDAMFRAAELSAQVHDGPQAAIPNLIRALDGFEWEVAAKALAKFKLDALPAIPSVLQYAESSSMLYADYPVNEVLTAVAREAETAPEKRVRELGLPILPMLVNVLTERKIRTSARYELFRIIRHMGLSAEELNPVLIACIQDGGHDGASLCKSVYYMLRDMDIRPPAMLPVLLRSLQERVYEKFGFAEELVDLIKLFGREPLTEAVTILLPAISDPSPDIRYAAAGGLGVAGELAAPAVPALIAALRDTTDGKRWRCADALGKIGVAAEAAVPALIQAMQDTSNSSAKSHAMTALGQIGRRAEIAIPALLTVITTNGQNSRTSEEASRALSKFGATVLDVLPALIDIVQTSSSAVRKGAIEVIEKLGAEASASLPVLLEVLEHDMDKWARVAAAKAMGAMGAAARNPMVIAALRQACQDDDLYVRQHIAKALGALDVDAALPILITVLQQSNIEIFGPHMDAIQTLGEWGARAAPAVPVLLEVLMAKDCLTRHLAINALAGIGTDAHAALPVLLAFDEPDANLLTASATAIWRIDPQYTPQALARCIRVLHSDTALERAVAIETLEKMGIAAEPALPELIAATQDDQHYVRQAAIKAVKAIQNARAHT